VRRGQSRAWLLATPVLVTIGVLLVLPYLNIVTMSFRVPSTTKAYAEGFTTDNYTRALFDWLYLETLADTLRLAAIITFFCLILAYPVAFHLARTKSRWRGLLYGLLLSPLLVGVVIRSFGWIILLANNGLVNQMLRAWDLPRAALMYNEFGVILALVHIFLPFMALPLMGAIQSIDPKLEEAARSLGGGKKEVFFRVLLPLSAPGIQSGCILVFILSCGAYVTPMLMGAGRVHTTTTTVVQMLDQFLWPFGAALALILAAVGVICVALFAFATNRFMRGQS
jgi:putative spermidine/putrescine transport system permease protein